MTLTLSQKQKLLFQTMPLQVNSKNWWKHQDQGKKKITAYLLIAYERWWITSNLKYNRSLCGFNIGSRQLGQVASSSVSMKMPLKFMSDENLKGTLKLTMSLFHCMSSSPILSLSSSKLERDIEKEYMNWKRDIEKYYENWKRDIEKDCEHWKMDMMRIMRTGKGTLKYGLD